MAANLIPALSQECAAPYQFKTTKTRVYSFEEALYHCYHFWKQSLDDFICDEFIAWVGGTLKLSLLAARIRALAQYDRFSEQLAAFAALTDYFDDAQIAALQKEIAQWEARNEWEKLKERGDDLMNRDDPEAACRFYEKALDYDENTALLNNLAIALMKTGDYGAAVRRLLRARALSPSDKTLALHLTEAHILDGRYDEAEALLRETEALHGAGGDTQFFYGEISFAQGRYVEAITRYETILAATAEPDCFYRLADAYVKLRQYDKALAVLQKVPGRDKRLPKKQADVYVAYNNIPAAIKCVEKALLTHRDSVDLWVRLARYHRMDYNLAKAEEAVGKALAIAKQNPQANIENARVKKAQGHVKAYQAILNEVLFGFKERYRENDCDAYDGTGK